MTTPGTARERLEDDLTFAGSGEHGLVRVYVADLCSLLSAEERLREALAELYAAFCAPMKRRAMGGHDLDQQAASIKARQALEPEKAGGELTMTDLVSASPAEAGFGGQAAEVGASRDGLS